MNAILLNQVVQISAFISAFIFLITIYVGLMDFLSGQSSETFPTIVAVLAGARGLPIRLHAGVLGKPFLVPVANSRPPRT